MVSGHQTAMATVRNMRAPHKLAPRAKGGAPLPIPNRRQNARAEEEAEGDR